MTFSGIQLLSLVVDYLFLDSNEYDHFLKQSKTMVTEIEEKQRSHSSPVKYVNFIPWNKNKVLNLFSCFLLTQFLWNFRGSFLLLLLEILGICLFPVKFHPKRYWLIHIQKDKLHLPKTREIWEWHKPKPIFLLIQLLHYHAWLTCHGICFSAWPIHTNDPTFDNQNRNK